MSSHSDEQQLSVPQALQLAMQNHQAGNTEQAEHLCRLIIRAEAGNAFANYILGLITMKKGETDEAIERLSKAVETNPEFAEACNALGSLYKGLEDWDQAAVHYRRAVKIRPDYAEAHNGLGVLLEKQGVLEEAIESYRRAIELAPEDARIHVNLGLALFALGRIEEAVESDERALALNPDYPEAHNDLGIALHELGRFGEAVVHYRKALGLRPEYDEATCNLSYTLLLQGQYGEGWAAYEKRYREQNPGLAQQRGFEQSLWDGSPLNGRSILLAAEQGLGDSLQFVRYAKPVAEAGGKVVVECQPELKPLFAPMEEIDTLVGWGETLPAFDVYAPLMSLPHILGTTLDNIPADIPYLSGENMPNSVRIESSPETKVGIVWAGNPKNINDRKRSVAIEYFAPLIGVPETKFYSLQIGHGSEDLAGAPFSSDIVDLAPQLTATGGPITAIASVVEQLDLVITVCTAVAHLAGAMGKSTWVLLSWVPDHRWLLDCDDSPWYPGLRLFRQPERGGWDKVFDDVAVQLSQFARKA